MTLTKAEQTAIAQAVAEAETRTSGEIVPYIVRSSDRYDITLWRGGVLLALMAQALILLIYTLNEGWGLGWFYTGFGVAMTTLLSGGLGALLVAYLPALKRWLAGADLLNRRVHGRAMQAFVEEEIFKTRDRTGILLFVSLLEHRIEVLGDEGINQKVERADWVAVVDLIRQGIQQGHLADGLVAAITHCGELLERKAVHIRPDDTDELDNSVRIRPD